MTEGSVKLLRELAALLRRHPPEDFEQLAVVLNRPDFSSKLALILNEVAVQARTHRVGPRKAGIAKLLEEIRASDPEKYSLLREANERLSDKRLYPGLADLTKVIETSGLPLDKTAFRKREELIRGYIVALLALPAAEIAHTLQRLPAARSSSDLRSWSNIIVPKKEGETGKP